MRLASTNVIDKRFQCIFNLSPIFENFPFENMAKAVFWLQKASLLGKFHSRQL